jgi:membrane associated rhomboid family serine protease
MALIAVSVAVFLFQEWLRSAKGVRLEDRAALSLAGLRAGHFWQLLSFQFLHGGWVHLLVNCWGIFVFGPALEMMLGKTRLGFLYLISGIGGGVVQILASILSYQRFGGQVVGASAGVFGLVAAFTQLFPDARMTVLLFFVIPLRMTANRMLTVAAIITVVGIVFPNWLLGTHVAHAAHLGGLVSGIIWVRLFMKRFRG